MAVKNEVGAILRDRSGKASGSEEGVNSERSFTLVEELGLIRP